MSKHNTPDSGGETALETGENRLTGAPDAAFVQGVAEWNGPDLAKIPIPDTSVRPKDRWASEERKAFMFRELRQAGHPDNLPKTQSQYGRQFGVTQQQISSDLDRVRQYIAAHTGDDAVTRTVTMVDKATKELMDEDPAKAVEVQMRFNEFLLDLGVLERSPERKEVASVTANLDSSDLDDDTRAKFDELARKMGGDDDSRADEPIDVEATETEPDE